MTKAKKHGQFGDIARRFMRNKAAVFGLIIILFLVFCAIFPQLIATHDYSKMVYSERLQAPSSSHIFGTDDSGRDIYSRVVYGCRVSLMIGLISVSIAAFVGVILGCLAGFYGSTTDNILMRIVDVLMAIPQTLLGISIVAALGASMSNLILAIGIGAIPAFARIVRSSVLTVKDQEYVEAARATGASSLRIILKYILPNCMAPLIVQVTMNIATAILTAAGLSFIGLGVPPPTPEWGSMLSSARNILRDYWYTAVFPGLAIMVTVFSFNLFGDGLRDALDPRLKQ